MGKFQWLMIDYHQMMLKGFEFQKDSLNGGFPKKAVVNKNNYYHIRLTYAQSAYKNDNNMIWEFMQVDWNDVTHSILIDIDDSLDDNTIIMK